MQGNENAGGLTVDAEEDAPRRCFPFAFFPILTDLLHHYVRDGVEPRAREECVVFTVCRGVSERVVVVVAAFLLFFPPCTSCGCCDETDDRMQVKKLGAFFLCWYRRVCTGAERSGE